MLWIESFFVALSTYSALPAPQFEWNEKNMKYALCFFPAVGLFCGGGLFGWYALCSVVGASDFFFAAGAVCLPLLITGGIHMDGYIDTMDALSSHQPRERKLEILKDSHCGAFAVIGAGCYLIFLTALCSELPLERDPLLCLCLGYLFSRAASGLAVTLFPCAKNSGLVHTFADMAARRQTRWILSGVLLLTGCGLIALGGGWAVAAAAAMFGIYYGMSMRIFGGITGDLAGWFLQWCELLMTAALVLSHTFAGGLT